MNFYHKGHCCVCGKTLTTPESIKNGIGPFCAGTIRMAKDIKRKK